jgi:hypothetical protein
MTLSDDTRRDAMDVALQRMLDDLGERMFDERRYEVDSDRYRDIPHTTWLELQGHHYVEAAHAIGSAGFRLTPAGWIAALRAAAAFDTPEQRQSAVRLRAALKDVVKGRPLTGAITDYRDIAARSGLPFNWIVNALQSRLLQHLWTWDHLDVAFEHGGRTIRVPARFGSKRLDYEAGPFPDP